MEDPVFESRGRHLYVMTWPTAHVRIRVDQLRERSGAVIGECQVGSTHPASPGHWLTDRLNLTNAKARTSTAALLKKREGAEDLPWDEILETVCALVLTAYRRGDPVLNVTTRPKPPPRGFLLEPFLLMRDISMFFGDGDSGKSLLAQYLALVCATGDHDAMSGLTPDRPINVLYLDFERSEDDFLLRLHALAAGRGVALPEVFYRRCYRRLADEADDIHRIITDLGIGLLIIDSVGAACGGEIQYAEPVFAYFSALRSFNLSVLHVHHITHQERKSDEPKSPYGSVYLRNYSTSTWEIRRLEEEDGMTIGCFHDKHNTTKRLNPCAYRLTFDTHAESIRLCAVDVNEIAQWAKRAKTSDRIVMALQGGGLTVTELSQRLGVSTQAISTAISREGKEDVPRFTGQAGRRGGLISLCDPGAHYTETDVGV